MPEVPDMSGKTCVITGATSGIGRATADALAGAGARLVLIARSREKAEATRAEIISANPKADISLHLADLSSLEQIRRVAPEVLAECPKIDVLLNNAGLITMKREETVDGFESMFGVNHLAYFLLTHLLLDRVRSTPGSRIVNVASEAHRFGAIDFDDLNSEKSFSSMRIYGRSKLANILFTRQLAERLGDTTPVHCLHPGAVSTGLGANNGWMAKLVLPLLRPFFRTPEQGAQTSIQLCSTRDLGAATGSYHANCKPKKPSAAALDAQTAERLWRLSEEFVGIDAS